MATLTPIFQDDLEEVISSDVDFGGTFSFQADCRTAPNPWLSLAKLGTVGLPLSVRDAAAIKAEANQAPFGKGERTIVDKNVRDTWEMDASEVRTQLLNHLRNETDHLVRRSLSRTPTGRASSTRRYR